MNRMVQAFAVGVGILGTLVLAIHGLALPLTLLLPDVPQILLLAGLAAVFEVYRVTMPNGVTFSFGLLFVCLVLANYGIEAAMWAEAAAALAVASRSRRWEQAVFNFGQYLLALGAAHLLWQVLSRWGEVTPVFVGLALTLATVPYFAVNIVLLAGILTLRTRRPFHLLLADILKEGYISIFGTVSFLWPLHIAYRQSGWMAVTLFASTLLAFRWAVNKYMQLKQTHLGILANLSALIARQVALPEQHAQQVAALARATAEGMKLPVETADLLYAAGLLHDIGEVELDPHVIAVASRGGILSLTDQDAFQRHPTLGADRIMKIPGMAEVATWVRLHHELWDGSGYPQGLRGEQCSLPARILAAAEFVESTQGELADKVAIIQAAAGKQIDPKVAVALESALHRCETPERLGDTLLAMPAIRELHAQVIQAARNSRTLESLGVAHFYHLEHGQILALSPGHPNPLTCDQLQALAARAAKTGQPVREQLPVRDRLLDVFSFPTGPDQASVIAFDVTEVVGHELGEYRRILGAYRDVLAVATRGRFLLVDANDCAALLAEGQCCGTVDLTTPRDGQQARRLVRQVGRDTGLTDTQVFGLTLCASETLTNVFKHAGRGRLEIRRSGDALRVIVTDHGGGIPLDILPRAVLDDGFSTQVSLGKGFHVLLKYANRLLVCTTPTGTTVVAEMGVPPATADVTDPQCSSTATTDHRTQTAATG